MIKTIAVIGASQNMASVFAYRLAGAGYSVLLTDDLGKRGTPCLGKLSLLLARMRFLASSVSVPIVYSAREASWEADIIILTVPCDAQPDLACRIKDVVTGKIIISLASPFGGMCGLRDTQELAQLLPYSKVVTLLHADSVFDFEGPQRRRTIGAVIVSGEDQEAVSIATRLAEDAGFVPRKDE